MKISQRFSPTADFVTCSYYLTTTSCTNNFFSRAFPIPGSAQLDNRDNFMRGFPVP